MHETDSEIQDLLARYKDLESLVNERMNQIIRLSYNLLYFR